eukprot:TRINITY_DN113936_c0_g1_i1.p1 TRINITY_DN113936_c0_g1~~TRINITY_DN113936_c0_g1_i1.p1  ORF type:complete len:303 (-),score=23.04 TRINITY_DN113936_c0_g1_i1:69-977(-)
MLEARPPASWYLDSFCQQVEFGLAVHLHDHHTRIEKKVEVDGWEEEPVDIESGDDLAFKFPKNFQYGKPQMLRVSGCSTLHNERSDINLAGKFDTVVIKNMPKEGDRGPAPDPEDAHLELWVSERETSGPFEQKKLRRLADVGDHYRVDFPQPDDRLEIRGDSHSEFRVMIDGDVFGTFVRVLIRPMLTPEGAQKVAEWRKEAGAIASGAATPLSGGSSSGRSLGVPGTPLSPMGSMGSGMGSGFGSQRFGRSASMCSSQNLAADRLAATPAFTPPAAPFKIADYQMQLKLMSFCETAACLM